MLDRLIGGDFNEKHDVTVGAEFKSYGIRVEDQHLRLQIWDTCGQEVYRSMTKIFYRGSHAVVICYSIADQNSFNNLKDWLVSVRSMCSPDVQVYLVGTKSDLRKTSQQVSKEQAI